MTRDLKTLLAERAVESGADAIYRPMYFRITQQDDHNRLLALLPAILGQDQEKVVSKSGIEAMIA
jgi:hypothetical protein